MPSAAFHCAAAVHSPDSGRAGGGAVNGTWWPAAGVAAFDWGWRPFPGVWLFVTAVAGGLLWWARVGDHAREPTWARSGG